MDILMRIFLLIITISISNLSFANTLLNALYESQESSTLSSAPGPTSRIDLGTTSNMQSSAQCSDKDQNTLPLRFVMGLLREKGATLRPVHDPSTGKLTINGGRMIGNCNSMLEYKLSEPDSERGLPYIFQVTIKGCGDDVEKCDYAVKSAKNGIPNDLGTMKFEPTMNGFMECLESTGVFKNGTIQSDNIAIAEFKAVKTGVNQSAELWFAHHGPYVDPDNGVFSDAGNKKPGMGCYYFEDIQKDGFEIYSKKDIDLNRKKDQFQNLCKSGNYRLIDQKIGDFQEVKYLQNILKEVRNELLLDEVKKVAKQLKDNEDYAGLKVSQIKSVIEDFEKYIIQPKRDELFGVYNNGSIVKKGLYHQIIDEENEDRKANLITEFLKGLDELNQYTESPYLSLKSLRQMESFKKKAPVDDVDWYNAALTLNRTINTAKAFTMPYEKNLKRYRTRNDQKFSSIPTISFKKTQDKIDKAQGKYARSLSTKRQLIEDEDYSKVGELRGRASRLRDINNSNIKKLQKAMAELEQEMYRSCCYVRQAGTFDQACTQRIYYRNHRQCAAELEEEMKFIVKKVEKMNKSNESLADSYEDEAVGWVSVEKDREEYYSSSEDDEDDDSTESGYNFNYTPSSSSTSNDNTIISGVLNPQGGYPSMMPPMGRAPGGYMGMPQMGMPQMGIPQMGMPQMGMPQMGMQYQMTPPFNNMGMGGYPMPTGGYTFGM